MNKDKILSISIAFAAGIIGAACFSYFKNDSNVYLESGYHQNYSKTANWQNVTPGMNQDFVKASSLSTHSVVYIKTSTSQGASYNWFDFMFNESRGSSISSGSGVIYQSNGYIVTNNHVIKDADKIEVIHNKKTYQAKVIGVDQSTDLAVIKIEATNLPVMKNSRSANVQVGEWVLAVGNPFNLASTVTAGIVSAKGRDIGVVKSRFPIESFIQTDAAINPGNSGGALVNIQGELIGINTAILSHTGSYAGYGFAVPIDVVNKAVKDLIQFGEIQKAFAGIEVTDIDEKWATKLNLTDRTGVVITDVMADGAGSKVGMQKGDIILKINDIPIDSKTEFDEQISCQSPGEKMRIVLHRNDKEISTSITLTNIEGGVGVVKRSIYSSSILGAELEKVSSIEKSKLGIKSGIRIGKMKNTSFFLRLGLEEGFIITSLNNKIIEDGKALEDEFQRVSGRVVIEGVNTEGVKGYYTFMF